MARMEDDDIKIFTSDKTITPGTDVDAEVLNTVEQIDHDRQNGNTNKARVMGKHLAKLFLDEVEKSEERDPALNTGEILQQIGVLFLFSAETAFNVFFPSPTLAAIAITAMHDQLEDRKSKLYRDVYESSAYSFYYLSLRKAEANVSQKIGESFAMLCQHDDDPLFIREGSSIYNKVLAEVENEVKRAKFVN